MVSWLQTEDDPIASRGGKRIDYTTVPVELGNRVREAIAGRERWEVYKIWDVHSSGEWRPTEGFVLWLPDSDRMGIGWLDRLDTWPEPTPETFELLEPHPDAMNAREAFRYHVFRGSAERRGRKGWRPRKPRD